VPRADELLDVLTAGGRRADRLTHVHRIAARTGTTGKWPEWVSPQLLNGLLARGAGEPWTHQVQAAELAWSGKHVALATSTGSGKSLSYWVPALTAVRGASDEYALGRIEGVRSRGTVLYLSPTKALAQDQLASVYELLRAAEIKDIAVDTCDGDTPFEARRWIQAHSDVVLTNPDYLHYSMLPGHARWASFFKRLRFVIIDEGHSYRGVFGAHVALVLRRLQRVVQYYAGSSTYFGYSSSSRGSSGPSGSSSSRGSDKPSGRRDSAQSASGPTFIVASATTAEPAVSAARLIGVQPEAVVEIVNDTSPRGNKTFALWQPPQLVGFDEEPQPHDLAGSNIADLALTGLVDEWDLGPLDALDDALTGGPSDAVVIADAPPPEQPRRAATAEAADLLADLVSHSVRSLAFTRSRRGAENVASHTQDLLSSVNPRLVQSVAAYRGGYLPEERRALEEAIRTGKIKALATTNALELGVDISGLDAVLIVGWPGTRVSMWQQAGRAGRAGADGLVVFVAREDPLDTYLVNHPEAIFDTPVEATVFDPTNPYVLAGHLCSAAAELPIKDGEIEYLGGPVALDLLHQLTERGTLRRREHGWYWTHEQNAADFTNIRGAGGTPVQVVERESGRLLGTVDAAQADGQVHNGAVYVHQGETYVVAEYNYAESIALVDRESVAYTTWSRDVTSIEITKTLQEKSWNVQLPGAYPAASPHVKWGFGSVDVHGQVIGFNRRRIPSGEILSNDSLDLPVRTLNTAAVWWSVSADLLEVAGLDMEEAPGALHAAEHASIGLLPLLATCDRWDLGGVSTAMHIDTERATVFVYDALPGGAGFAERGFAMAREWLTATLDAITGCGCVDGCPACVQSPKCGNGNNPLSKAGAIRLLRTVLTGTPRL